MRKHIRSVMALSLLALFLLTACESEEERDTTSAYTTAEAETTSSPVTNTPIKSNNPTILSDANVVLTYPKDGEEIENFEEQIKDSLAPWIYATLNHGLELSEELVLECAVQAFKLSLTMNASIYPVESGAYVPIDSVQFMLDKQVENAPKIEDYEFGSIYRSNPEYPNCIFIPKGLINKPYARPLNVKYFDHYYKEEGRILPSLILNNGSPNDEIKRRYDLTPFYLNGCIYFCLNEVVEEFLARYPERTTTIITDYRDWEKLGISCYDERYRYIRAFVTGDTKALGRQYYVGAELHDPYKAIVLKDYKIEWVDTVNYYHYGPSRGDNIIFSFTVESADSPLLDLSVGYHRYYLECGLDYLLLDYRDNQVYERGDEFPTAGIINILRGQNLPDLEKHENNHHLTGYIYTRLSLKLNIEPTEEEMIRYAKEILGIDNFKPYLDPTVPMGAYKMHFRVLSEEMRGDEVCTTVQYYADGERFIKSQKIEYYFEPVGDDYKPLRQVIVEDTGLKTGYIST